MRRRFLALLTLLLLMAVAVLSAADATAKPKHAFQTICHVTGSESNPYRVMVVDARGGQHLGSVDAELRGHAAAVVLVGLEEVGLTGEGKERRRG